MPRVLALLLSRRATANQVRAKLCPQRGRKVIFFLAGLLALPDLLFVRADAQVAGGTLTGTVTNTSRWCWKDETTTSAERTGQH
jgi:hypothetical protein